MKHNPRMKTVFVMAATALSAVAFAVTAGQTAPQPAASAPAGKLFNAALPTYGAKVSVDTPPNVVRDKQTSPDAYLDGNPHSRFVITGAPYTINLTLAFKLPVERIAFSHSDYASEAAPKDLEISFDDGPPVRHTLELKRPQKQRRGGPKIGWQEVPVGREVQKIKVTVLSNYEGTVKWGGLGDIAVWTAVNLDEKFRVPGHDPAAPVFVHASSPLAGGPPVKVNLPPVAKPGEHPRLLFTPQEMAEFRAALPRSERGKATLQAFMNIANGGLASAISYPSVEDTVANKAGKEHDNLSKRAGTLGLAYGLTSDVKYARVAREILVGYGQRYAGYPRHAGRNRSDSSKITFQRLSEAMWLIPLLESYDYIYSSGVLSDADRKTIEDGLIRPAIAEIRRAEPTQEAAAREKKTPDWRTTLPTAPEKGGAVGNWLNFYNTATMMAGAILNDRDMMDLAAADFRGLLMKGIGADGMWGEGAIGYQLFAMSAMAPGFETAARQGIDLWGFDNARFKQLFDSPLRYAYPDGTMPGINDSGRAKMGTWQTMVYDYGLLRYGDPRYAFLVNSSPRQLHFSEGIYSPTRLHDTVPEPPSVNAASTLFGNLGYAILRDDNKYALLDYGPHGGTHGHRDKLNLLLFARGATGAGDEMGGEPVFHGYTDPLHGQWTVQTVAHNTLAVDETSQMPGEGKLLIYEDTPAVKLMRGESASSYPGALLDRTVLIAPDAVIDLYHGNSPISRTWDRTFRYKGKLAQLPAAATGKPLGQGDGFQHFQVATRTPATGLWQGVWQNEAGQFEVALAGAPGQQMILGTGPDKDEMALARQTGKRADFAAVYALRDWGNAVQAAQWVATGDAAENGASVFEMTQKDGTKTHVVVAHNSGAWQAAGWKSDARVLYVRQKGEDLQLLIGGGTFAQNGPLELRQPAAGNYLARQNGAKLEAVSTWTP